MTSDEVVSVANLEIDPQYQGKGTATNLDDATANPSPTSAEREAEDPSRVYRFTKYARDLDAINFYNFSKNGFDWCCVFVDWCLWVASGRNKTIMDTVKPYTNLGAACYWTAKAYKDANRYDQTPKIGDQIFYKNSDGDLAHTGLVKSISGDNITTIEGNWGNKTCQRIVTMSGSYGGQTIDGFGHPYYSDTPVGTQITQFQFRNNEGIWGSWQNSDSYVAPSYINMGTYNIGLRVRYYNTGTQQIIKVFPNNSDPTEYYTIEQKILKGD